MQHDENAFYGLVMSRVTSSSSFVKVFDPDFFLELVRNNNEINQDYSELQLGAEIDSYLRHHRLQSQVAFSFMLAINFSLYGIVSRLSVLVFCLSYRK